MKAKYYAMMVLGALCYPLAIYLPASNNRAFMWLLSWAGFYAYSDGYENWIGRLAEEAKEQEGKGVP
jgi:hypothetical protein